MTAPLALAVAALVLGILALVLSPFLIGGALGLLGLPLSVLYLRRRAPHRAMAWWALALSALGMVASTGMGALYYHLYRKMEAEMAGLGATHDDTTSAWEGVQAPSLTLTTLDGERVDLTSLKGRPVVLNFWATWCAACRQEMPHLSRLARETPFSELAILGVSEEDQDTLKAFVDKEDVAYRIASASALPAPFDRVEALPTTAFIDRQGVIREVHVGYQDFETLKARALGPDYQGTPPPATGAASDGLTEPLQAQALQEVWTHPLPQGRAVTTCAWQSDGSSRLLAADGAAVHVFDAGGREEATLRLPGPASSLECFGGRDGSQRLLSYANWGNAVFVADGRGQALWSYRSGTGVNGAHWGDLDGDGRPEMIAGMNGNGGLHGVGSDGRRLWSVTEIGNVWSQAVVSTGPNSALVVASEAGGSVHLYDGEGNPLGVHRPHNDYYSSLDAAVIDDQGGVQVVAAGRQRVVAFDAQGKLAWQATLKGSAGSWRGPVFAHGDLSGDAFPEWVFADSPRSLVVVSVRGERLARAPLGAKATAFAVLPAASGKGQLVTLVDGTLHAYSLR
jgi:peroxiredoxin